MTYPKLFFLKQPLQTLSLLILSILPVLAWPQPDLIPTAFRDLPRWQQDQTHIAFSAFQSSCQAILKKRPNATFGFMHAAGKVQAWQTICRKASVLTSPSDEEARNFFEKWFTPYAVMDDNHPYGLFTGYYLPLLRANLQRTAYYAVPVYGLPHDLLEISVTTNRKAPFHTVVRQIRNGYLYPYPDRAAINRGAIAYSAPVLMWIHNPIDLFFAQIQGSATVLLPNHEKLVLGFAGHNGRPYTSIGRLLVDKGALTPDTVSMQTIRAWLSQHPFQALSLLNANQSYVFFHIMPIHFPVGTESVPLTPKRTLAVDSRFIPLGAPIWLSTVIPKDVKKNEYLYYHHLMIAQDTGSAIKGVVRGDVFWGDDDNADFLAGNMKSPGQYWVLLPKN